MSHPPTLRELGQTLVEEGLITESQLQEALREQRQTLERLGEILCRKGYLTQRQLLEALSLQLGYPLFDPARDGIDSSALDIISPEFASRHNLLPVRVSETTLTVATADPLDVEAVDRLRGLAADGGRKLELLIATEEMLRQAREANYGRVEGNRIVNQLIDRVADEAADTFALEEEPDEREAQRRAEEAGIVSLVDRIIGQALQERATDIHLEPLADGLLIRYRVDGLLSEALRPPKAVYTGTISRLKILANLDIAERRAPQDGRFTFRKGGREVDIRVSSIPTIHGEKLVLRLLDKTNFAYSLAELGFSEEARGRFVQAIHQPHGMILLSGPTGSGKSTTLYAGLLELRNEALNITTVEDPVEYQIERINQVQVNSRKGVTFARMLRHFLRQDPDVIMVGEIRDQDTAEIAVRAALTGHMVFSTIHANDAPTTATRLLSMGVEPFMTASACTLVAAQRLVRRNCPHCLEQYVPSEEVLFAAGLAGAPRETGPWEFRRGAGCAVCRGRGYLGRVAIIELMPITTAVRSLIAAQRPAGEIRTAAVNEGMRSLREDGLVKAAEGTTTVEEVVRVCLRED